MANLLKLLNFGTVFLAIIAGTCCPQPACYGQSTGSTGKGPAETATGSPKNAPENQQNGTDWTRFLGPNGDGTSSETGIRKDWTGGKLPVRWSRKFGTGYGIGSVAKGRYLQFHRIADRETLTCLDAATGEQLWSVDQPVSYEDMYGYNNGPRTSPTIDGGLVYTMGVAGTLTCRLLEDGSPKWTVDTSQRFGVVQNFFGVGCSPLVVGDLVWVMVGGSPAEDQRLPPGRLDRVSPNGSALVAFDTLTGEERFRVGNYLASYASLQTIELENQTLILAFVREGLLAVNARTGVESWMLPWRASSIESVNASIPVVGNDLVGANQILISECYQLGSALIEAGLNDYKVLRSDADNRRLQSFRAHWSTPILVGGSLFGCSGRNPPDSDLRCVDWASGEVRWSDPRRERSSLLGVDGHFVVLNERGGMELIAADTTRYRPITSLDLSRRDPEVNDRPELRYPCWAAPILSHGLLYVRGDETVICFELIPQSKDQD